MRTTYLAVADNGASEGAATCGELSVAGVDVLEL